MKLPQYQESLRELTQCTQISLSKCILRVQHDFHMLLRGNAPVLARFTKDDLVETLLAKHAMEVAKDPDYQRQTQPTREGIMRIHLSRRLGEHLEQRISSQAEAVALVVCLEHFSKTYVF